MHARLLFAGTSTAVACLLIAAAGCKPDAPSPPAATSRPAGAIASPPAQGPAEQISPWQPIFVGVEMCQASAVSPRPVQIRAVRVDLREPTVDLLVTPSNGKGPMDCAARTVSEFLTEFKCQVAMNGSVFGPLATQPGDPTDVKGLSLSRGDLYSPANKYDALLIGKDRKAWIDRSPIDVSHAYNGLSGYYALLVDGRNNGTDKDIHPRSAVGISRDGRYLILMTIDGRQAGYSEGATTRESAEWIAKLGAHNALNLDGGGSTALVIQGPDGKKPLLLNRPSGIYERRVANHLGVFAQPLPTPNGR